MIKKILLSIIMVFICFNSYAADKRLAKYGVEYVLNFELFEVDGVDFRIDAADGGTDCTVRKDQGADATATNDFVDEGLSYSLTVTATEMQAKEVIVHVVDSATKVWLDKAIVIETYGNASALHAMDFDDAVRGGMTALPNAVADAAGGLAISDAGGLDIDTKLANTNEVTVARMGALTDWINGGRLDLLLDAIKAVTDLLPDAGALNDLAAILTDTGTTLDNHLTDIKGTAFVKDTHSLIDIETFVDILDDGTSGNVKIATDVAAVLVDTGTTLDGKIDTIDTNVDSILVDTAEIGAAGAGLTAINLPNQTMDIVGDITGNLSGSVGSVTGAVGSVAGNVDGSIGSLGATAKTDVNTEVDNALDTALPASPTTGSINDVLDRQEETIVYGSAATGTLSTTEMTTNLTVTVNDQFNGRILTFRKDTTTAALRGQQTDITDTVTTNGKLTFTALTTAPANGDVFDIN